MNTNELMSIAEAVETLKIARAAVYAAIDRGEIQTVVVSGKRFLLRKSVCAYQPRSYRGREGRAVGGRPRKQKEGAGEDG